MRLLYALPLILAACSGPAPVPSASAAPPIKQYSCDFALKLSPEILAAPPELQTFATDYEQLRYANAAARGEPDPVCKP